MDEIEERDFFPTCFIMFQKAQYSFDQQIPKSPCVPWKVVTILGARLWWRPNLKENFIYYDVLIVWFSFFSNRHTPYHISLVNCFFWGCKTFSYVQLCIHVVLCLSLWKIMFIDDKPRVIGWSRLSDMAMSPGCQDLLEVGSRDSYEFSGNMIL